MVDGSFMVCMDIMNIARHSNVLCLWRTFSPACYVVNIARHSNVTFCFLLTDYFGWRANVWLSVRAYAWRRISLSLRILEVQGTPLLEPQSDCCFNNIFWLSIWNTNDLLNIKRFQCGKAQLWRILYPLALMSSNRWEQINQPEAGSL